MFVCVSVSSRVKCARTQRVYDRRRFFRNGKWCCGALQPDVLHRLGKVGLLSRPGPVRRHRKWCERTRKQGKRGGVCARLEANPSKPAVPTVLLANVRLLDSKMDYIRLCRTFQCSMKYYCVLIFTKTWLGRNIEDTAVGLEGMTLHRADRDAKLTGKHRGGGVAIYTNNLWCRDTEVISTVSTLNIEALMVRCHPFYLPQELSVIIIVAVYVAPDANGRKAMEELHDIISTQQTAHLDAFFITAGDYNQASLTSVLPKFHQHVNFATRGSNTLDLVYTNIKDSHRAAPLPHIGNSNHLAVMLTPKYRPRVRHEKAEIRNVRIWPQNAITTIQDCFGMTQWDIFREAATYDNGLDLEEYTGSVIGYIGKCIEDVTGVKTLKCHNNQKPWMCAES